MRQANNAILLGVVKNTTEMGKLAEAGRRLGRATGRTAAQGFADLATGIGRQSRLILDNLGIIISAERAYKAYAKSVDKAVTSLTDAEKRLAFQRAAFEAIDNSLAKLGPDMDTVGDKFNRFTANFRNFFIQLSRNVSDSFGGLLDAIESLAGDDLMAVFTANLNDAFTSLAKFVDENKDGIEEFISSVAAAARTLHNILESMAQGFAKFIKNVKTYGLGNAVALAFQDFLTVMGPTLRALWFDILKMFKTIIIEIVEFAGLTMRAAIFGLTGGETLQASAKATRALRGMSEKELRELSKTIAEYRKEVAA